MINNLSCIIRDHANGISEDNGKRVILDKATGKLKEVDAYDRPEPSKKKVETDKVRAMLSSNNEHSLIPADKSIFLWFHIMFRACT